MRFKRIISAILVLSAIFTLAACGSKDGEDTVNTVDDGAQMANGGSDAAKTLFSKVIDVADGVSAELGFVGYENNVRDIRVSVNGKEKKAIDVTAVSESIIGDKSGAVSEDSEFLFKSGDFNFDGYQDFMIQSWKTTNSNESYYFFIWDSEAESFAFSFQMANPLFDSANGRIYSSVYEGGDEYVYVYRPADDGSVLLMSNYCVTAPVTFTEDISDYEQYMNPEDRDGYLILVNKTNLIGPDYAPNDLCDLADTRSDRAARQMRLTAAMALEAMYIEMRAAGYTDVSVTSAYRSYSEQDSLYNTYINQEMSENGYSFDEAKKVVDTYSAAPGTSEHQTGLCCDMHNLPAADQAFARQEVYNWLTENAWKFGFILRFPEDKEDITTYEFEPWHYRFVGRYHAQKIHNFGLCLEEYLELIG